MKSVYMANASNTRSALDDDIAFIDGDDEDDSLSQHGYSGQQKGEAERVGVFHYSSKPVVESSMLIENSTSCSNIDNYYLGPRSTLPLANAGAKQFKQASRHLNSKAFSAKEGYDHLESYQGSEWRPASNDSNWQFTTNKDASESVFASKNSNQYNSHVRMFDAAINDEVRATCDSSESDSSQEIQQKKLNKRYIKHHKSAECNAFQSEFMQPAAHFNTQVDFSLLKSSSLHAFSKVNNSTEENINGIPEAKSCGSRSMLATSKNLNNSPKENDITIDNGNKNDSERSVTSESRRTIDMMLGNGLSVMGNSGLMVPQYRLLNEDRTMNEDDDVDYESKSVVQKLERMQRRRQARLEKQAIGLCKADSVPGFRGDESIDELISYIDASQLPAKQKASINKQNKKKKATKRNEKMLERASDSNDKSPGVKKKEIMSCSSSEPKVNLLEETDSQTTGSVLVTDVSETGSLSSVKCVGELMGCINELKIKDVSADELSVEVICSTDLCFKNVRSSTGFNECDIGSQRTVDVPEVFREFENQSGLSLNANASSFDEVVSTSTNIKKTSEDYSKSVHNSDTDFVDAFVTVHRKKRVKNLSDGISEKSLDFCSASIDFAQTSSSEQLHRPPPKQNALAGFYQRGVNDKRALSTQSASLTRSYTKSWSNRSHSGASRSHVSENQFDKVTAKSHITAACVEDSSTCGTDRKSDASDAKHNTDVVVDKISDDIAGTCSNVLTNFPTRYSAVISDATSQQQPFTVQALTSGVQEVVGCAEMSRNAEQSDEALAEMHMTRASLDDLPVAACPNKEMIAYEPLEKSNRINPVQSKATNANRRVNQSVVFLDTQHLQDLTPVRSDISFGFDPQVPSLQQIVADASEDSPVVTPVLHYVPGCPSVVYCVPPFAMLPPVAFLPPGRCTPIGVVPPMPSEIGQTDLIDSCTKVNTVTPASSCRSPVFNLFSAQLFMHSEFQQTLESDPIDISFH